MKRAPTLNWPLAAACARGRFGFVGIGLGWEFVQFESVASKKKKSVLTYSKKRIFTTQFVTSIVLGTGRNNLPLIGSAGAENGLWTMKTSDFLPGPPPFFWLVISHLLRATRQCKFRKFWRPGRLSNGGGLFMPVIGSRLPTQGRRFANFAIGCSRQTGAPENIV